MMAEICVDVKSVKCDVIIIFFKFWTRNELIVA